MGKFLDYGNSDFQRVKNSDFIDKSGLISVLNSKINTEKCFVCISRPRRFGKSVAAKMLYAYYDRSCDSHNLFDDLEIAKDPYYDEHLNKYPTIYLDLNRDASNDTPNVVYDIQADVIADLKNKYPSLKEKKSLMKALEEINDETGERFIFIIDEWDRLVREVDSAVQIKYVNFLREMFKTNTANKVFLLVYMTGILPIIKVEAQSALNNFDEFSVIDPGQTAKYYGFTKEEVELLCKKYNMDFDLMKHAYDGYIFGDQKSMFNPNSVMLSVEKRNYNSHWSKSASYTTIERYIEIDHDNVQQKIIKMLNGESITVRTTSFRNDMKNIDNSDDVLTLLAHLGYLSYDPETLKVNIPNTEVAGEFEISIGRAGWGEVSAALNDSLTLINKTIDMDADYIAEAFDKYRFESSSIIKYKDENSMACAITLAYYAAKKFYKIFREQPAGKGFADMVFVPLPNSARPAIVVELKHNKSAVGAVDQIKNKNYPDALKGFSKKIILVGINWSKRKARHDVKIEEYQC
ncbi:MAG: ATP-binding protein [Bacteroidales bacterium]|nr:ATP-binding protein [Bacteroidales bacterium]